MSHFAEFPMRLEGEHRWGYIDASPASRTVWMHRRLSVYPPGITSRERGILLVHRNWPVVGAVVVLFATLALSEVLSPAVAMCALVMLYGGSIVVMLRLTQPLRERIRSIEVDSIVEASGLHSEGDVELFRWARAELERLDAANSRGELTPVDFEAGWSRVYDRIDAE